MEVGGPISKWEARAEESARLKEGGLKAKESRPETAKNTEGQEVKGIMGEEGNGDIHARKKQSLYAYGYKRDSEGGEKQVDSKVGGNPGRTLAVREKPPRVRKKNQRRKGSKSESMGIRTSNYQEIVRGERLREQRFGYQKADRLDSGKERI